jgi:hypothetical protein
MNTLTREISQYREILLPNDSVKKLMPCFNEKYLIENGIG